MSQARGLLAAALLAAGPAPAAAALAPFNKTAVGVPRVPRKELPLAVLGRDVVGQTGIPIPLACVNWYGFHLEQMVPNGINVRPIDKIAEQIWRMGFNCVRLPYSEEVVHNKSIVVDAQAMGLKTNTELHMKSPLEVMDITVASLTKNGLLVILNSHISQSKWCCSENDGEGLWYTTKYPKYKWLASLEILAQRYKDNPMVVGFDLRNEIRNSDLGTPTWGGGNPATDWSMAAVEGGKIVRAVNKNLLVIISGLHYSQFLCDVPHAPVHVTEEALRGHTLYTAHEYSWLGTNLGEYHKVARSLIHRYLMAFFALWALRVGYVACRGCVGIDAVKCCCHYVHEYTLGLLTTGGFVGALLIGEFTWSPCGSDDDVWGSYHTNLALLPLGALSLLFLFRTVVMCMDPPTYEDDVAARDYRGRAKKRASPRVNPAPSRVGAAEDEDITDEGAEEHEAVGILHKGQAQTKPTKQKPRVVPCWLVLYRLIALALVGALAYGWRWLGSYEAFERELDSRWGYLLTGHKEGAVVAPVWLGEFGTDTNDEWWQHMVRYIIERRVSFAYWALNGEKRLGKEDETFGLLKRDSQTVRHLWKLRSLQQAAHALNHFEGALEGDSARYARRPRASP